MDRSRAQYLGRSFLAHVFCVLLLLLPMAALASSFTVHGQVTRFRDGAPLADADVYIYLNDFPWAQATTSANGDYSIEDDWNPLPGDTASIEVYASGYLPVDRSFDPEQSATLADFALHGASTISGTVADAAGNAPAQNTFVRILHQNGSSEWIELSKAATSTSGEYVAGGLPAGTYRACVDGIASGMVRQCFDGIDVATMANIGTATPIVLAEEEARNGINFVRSSGSAVTGFVIDAFSGHGIADVNIAMELYDLGGNLIDNGIVHTDAAGAYRLQGVPPGVFYLTARVNSHGFKAKQLFKGIDCPSDTCPPVTTGQSLMIADGGTLEDVDFTIEPDAVVRGVVVDADGHPLGNMHVFACTNWFFLPSCTYTTDSSPVDGSYVLDISGGWTYTFMVRASEDYADQTYPNITCNRRCGYDDDGNGIAVNSGDRLTGIDFSLPQSTHLSGFVRDTQSGAPLSSVGITVYDATYKEVWTTNTSNGGAYQGEKWGPGTYYVKAIHWWPPYPCAFYRDRACPDESEPISSVNPTPVVLGPGESRTDIDFHLESMQIFADGFEASGERP